VSEAEDAALGLVMHRYTVGMQPPRARRSQSETAYVALHRMIKGRQIVPGDLLSENAIARKLGMSRTPVREAISRLVQEGLLDVVPSRGVVVTSPTLTDLEEIYAIRELLEGLASRTAATRASPAAIEDLGELLARMGKAVEAGDEELFSDLDMDFHGDIAKASGSRRLKHLLDTMRTANAAAYFKPEYNRRNPRSARSHAEHQEIFEAIRDRNPEQAEKAARAHTRAAIRDVLLDAFPSPE